MGIHFPIDIQRFVIADQGVRFCFIDLQSFPDDIFVVVVAFQQFLLVEITNPLLRGRVGDAAYEDAHTVARGQRLVKIQEYYLISIVYGLDVGAYVALAAERGLGDIDLSKKNILTERTG